MLEPSYNITHCAVKKTYKFYAPIYDFLFGAILEPGRRALCDEVHLWQPDTLLEVGVGTGLLLEKYPASSKITGVDISDEMLDIARSKTKKLPHMDIRLEAMDGEKLSFGDNSFDCVVLPYVLSVTPNPEALVNELRRVCRKDGIIIILNHFSGSGAWYLLEKTFKNLAEKIGFRSEFSYDKHVLIHDWEVLKTATVNLLGLSKLVVIRNA